MQNSKNTGGSQFFPNRNRLYDPKLLEKVVRLRQALHACPELSGHEEKTKLLLKRFLQENTTLELNDCGAGFYAAHIETKRDLPGIALRADYDALPLPNGGAAHLCGHDGHAAVLCGVALILSNMKVGRNVFLLFQPAEETGEGAQSCLELFDLENVGEIYGAHDLPGFPFGEITTREGTFACASQGVTLELLGKSTHAAYPELGISPANTVGRLLSELPGLVPESKDGKLLLCTVIGAQLGEKAFGMAASNAEVWLTMRAERDEDLSDMHRSISGRAQALASEAGLKFQQEVQDVFPATVNDRLCAERVLTACHGKVLEQPMRWSEDFGHYLKRCKGAFFGIGAGAEQPPLHNTGYDYPDSLLLPSIDAFLNILESFGN